MDDKCISCGDNPVTWPRVCKDCRDEEAQAELADYYMDLGDDPNEWKCRTCGMIYDGGQFCTYCGDRDPLDTGEMED